jgi:hypothetical protein
MSDKLNNASSPISNERMNKMIHKHGREMMSSIESKDKKSNHNPTH